VLAVAWPWDGAAGTYPQDLSRRLAASLSAGIGGQAGHADAGGIHFAYRHLHSSASSARAWRPATLPNGSIAVFHGYFDNAAEIATMLGADAGDLPLLYGLAVSRWGDEADRKIVGEYCTVIAMPGERRLRLSRSPLRAPPLCYFHDDGLTAAASVPRALFAIGVEQRINEARLADSALLNFTDPESGWFVGVSRVPIGSIIELQPGKPRSLRTYYDPLAIPDVQLRSDADVIARASELLDEGVKACVAGFRSPGATLSGGLDSPQVAIRALANLPATKRLPTFTFHPEEGFDGLVEPWMFADDRPSVEAFAAMHPRLEPHFTSNYGYEHDYRLNEFFHLLGGAPSCLCNMYVFHGLFSGAQKRGCDVLLVADWGNETFSNGGNWGFVEYLFTGRWRQYWLALSRLAGDESIARRFVSKSIMPLLPEPLWRLVRRLAFPSRGPMLEQVQPLTPEYRRASGAERRLRASGFAFDRFEPRNRKHAHNLQFGRGDFEMDEIYQGFEQMYGVAQRDPTAYRPFVEFCLGLPTRMFMRDGQTRWLARQMARGIMPEGQRLSPLNGRWDSDWHVRIGRRRHEYIAELDRLAGDERVASMVDLPRLRGALEDWPDHTLTDRHMAFSREVAVPRGLLTARFVKWAEGRNI
jgi:asparagine synthase (glutamine-hydrolysing)